MQNYFMQDSWEIQQNLFRGKDSTHAIEHNLDKEM